MDLLFCLLISPNCSLWGGILVSIERELAPSIWSEGELFFTLRYPSERSVSEFLFTLRSPSEMSVGELLFTLQYTSEWSVSDLFFTLRSPYERSVGDFFLNLRYPSERSVRVFRCFPVLDWNSSGGIPRWLLKRSSQLSGIFFVILDDVVVKSSSKTMCNCGEIYPVFMFTTRATLPVFKAPLSAWYFFNFYSKCGFVCCGAFTWISI